jgi:DNA-binding NtrC family response regulator
MTRENPERPAMMSTTMPPDPRFQVLVVDDDPAMLQSIASVLADDADVVTCSTPERAIELLRSRPFHVVCSDFKMPGMDGVELLRRVADAPEHVGCLLLTGSDEYRPVDNPKYYVLLKPFDPARLIGLVVQLARFSEMKRSVKRMTAVHGGEKP